MVEWFLHTEPDAKYSSKQGKSPECILAHSPPFIDGLHFINPHDDIGEEIDD